MAARLNRHHSEQVLERIQLSNLVTRLQKNALRQLRNPKDENEIVTMTDGEIKSAVFLIERKLPRAESTKKVDVSITLEQILLASLQQPAVPAISNGNNGLPAIEGVCEPVETPVIEADSDE